MRPGAGQVAIEEELRYNEQKLKKQDMAPYFMGFRVLDGPRTMLTSSFGAIIAENDYHTRMFVPPSAYGNPGIG
ncbi:MAG: hypothetical protein ACLUDU_04910 [Butyricimonas faecihominis]